MMLVGDVANRLAILVDDLADTSNTITRAAKLLKKEGATKVYALLTHGLLSGDAIERINASALDKVVVTNSVPQEEHQSKCPKLEVLDVGTVFAEVRLSCFFGFIVKFMSLTSTMPSPRQFGECIMARVSVCCFSTTDHWLGKDLVGLHNSIKLGHLVKRVGQRFSCLHSLISSVVFFPVDLDFPTPFS
jgi:hypothetical protein